MSLENFAKEILRKFGNPKFGRQNRQILCTGSKDNNAIGL